MVNHKDIVWLDGYSFNEDFKANLRSRVYMLAETNDLPYKVQNVDILFNHTPAINDKQFDVVEPNTTLYLGLDYALLRKAFLEKAKQSSLLRVDLEFLFVLEDRTLLILACVLFKA